MDKQNNGTKSMSYIMNTKNWWGPLTFILIISLLGVGMIGYQTYIDAPPMAGFSDEKNNQIFDQKTIERGQEVFHKYALMEYGSFFGDGAQRGPDFTAEALHQISVGMSEYYFDEFKTIKGTKPDKFEIKQINEKVKQDGSLSVYCGNLNRPYVNIETEHGKLSQYRGMLEKLLEILTATNKKSPPVNGADSL